jgi:transglutaminase-like putative cysteine protease
MKWSYSGVLIAVCLWCGALQAQNKKIRIEKEPLWITTNPIDYSNSQLDHEAEDGYIDLDYEKQVNLEQQSIYYKVAFKIISEAGVQNNSKISINFDPSYEQLIIHSIKIIRENESLNKLQFKKIKIIEQEAELERHIYDQSLSAVLILEDVRKGDIIEYSYTLKGFNTIYKGKYADSYRTAFSVPIYNLYYNIAVPAGRIITIKNNGTAVQPVIKRMTSGTIYEWKQSNIAALRIQDDLPSWYEPYPEIMVSEYSSWKEVNDWAIQLFPNIMTLPPQLQKKVNDIIKKDTGFEKRIMAAIRFVQDDVRYMGFEMGENSHRPFSPEKVLAQRFGDCKDKSYLLCTILHALNVEANPVLINSDFKKTIKTWLPSPVAFNHVIVQVKLNNGFFYFDPTIPYQRGKMKDISFPDYQCGLTINESTTGLIDIPMHEKGMVKVKEVFNIPDMSGKAQLKVISVYTGSFADDIRNSFENNSNYEMLKKFRDYYAAYFEKIKEDSISVKDNDTIGNFTTVEYYTISDLWKIEEGRKKVQFESFVINGVLKKPSDIERRMPFSISYPAWYKEVVEINLPEEWAAKDFSDEISCRNFFIKADFSHSYKKFLLEYEFKSYKDHVSPEETPQFLDSYKQMDKSLAYRLTYGKENSDKTEVNLMDVARKNPIILFVGIFIVAVIGIIIWRILRNS